MSVIVFLGPTLPASEARGHLDATYLPPAAFGDVYRVALSNPFAIGIVDGYFEHRPAVWHKEVLWALSQGIHVFGAASLGALRAAELAAFGMQGVGEIYHAICSGDLTDDDEVAVAHADASSNYRASSEAMVNIRATLAAAEQAGIIASELRARLEQIAKSMFYPERNYASLIRRAQRELGYDARLSALHEFISSNRVDLKRADTLRLLATMKQCSERAAAPNKPSFELSPTEPWSQLRAWAHRQPSPIATSTPLDAALIAAEVRGVGARGAQILSKAMLRAASAALQTRDELATGSRERQLDRLDALVVEEARRSELWIELVRRANDKQQHLDALQVSHGDVRRSLASSAAMVEWYLARIGSDLPNVSELTRQHVVELGLSDVADLEREAMREYLYVKVLDR